MSHESWLCSASLNANMANNRRVRRNLDSTFGDDTVSTLQMPGGTMPAYDPSTPQASQISSNTELGSSNTLQNQSVSQGKPALGNAKGSATTDPAPTPLVPQQTLTQQVVDAAAQVMSAGGTSAAAVQQGAALTLQGASGPALGAALAAQAENAKIGFNAGVALANGSTKVVPPPSLSPEGQAGYLMTHGMVGAPPAVKGRIAEIVAKTPAARVGMSAGISELKNFWHRLLVWLHLSAA